MLIEALSSLATRRQTDLFAPDLESHRPALTAALESSRVLAIGGAGSIGLETVKLLARFDLAALHIVDQNENGLAEVVRDLRSQQVRVPDLRTLPIDFGSLVMRRFLRENGPYHYVLNFAALKHVRSEKDIYSLLQLFDTNIRKQARLLGWLKESTPGSRYFSVSTDKAANPANFMGASKRLMEHVIFAERYKLQHATSARFANVAFSDGSLPHAFLRRLEKRQPLAAPRGVRRYFVSLQEAGQICVLAACIGKPQHLLIPRLDAQNDLVDLETLAREVLAHFDWKPRIYESEAKACSQLAKDTEEGYYPLLLTRLNTSGEKPCEEFVSRGERVEAAGFTALQAIRYQPADPAKLDALLSDLDAWLEDPERAPGKTVMAQRIQAVVPEFHHKAAARHLDQRM